MKQLHNCVACGKSQSKRQYWKYIIDNDDGTNHCTRLDKATLLNLILTYIELNETNTQATFRQNLPRKGAE